MSDLPLSKWCLKLTHDFSPFNPQIARNQASPNNMWVACKQPAKKSSPAMAGNKMFFFFFRCVAALSHHCCLVKGKWLGGTFFDDDDDDDEDEDNTADQYSSTIDSLVSSSVIFVKIMSILGNTYYFLSSTS